MNEQRNALRTRIVETMNAVLYGQALIADRANEVSKLIIENKIEDKLRTAIISAMSKHNDLIVTENSIKWDGIELMIDYPIVPHSLIGYADKLIDGWLTVNDATIESLLDKFIYPTHDGKIKAVGFGMVVSSMGLIEEWHGSYFKDYLLSPLLDMQGYPEVTTFSIDTSYEKLELLGD